jgi:hypothetical protein
MSLFGEAGSADHLTNVGRNCQKEWLIAPTPVFGFYLNWALKIKFY